MRLPADGSCLQAWICAINLLLFMHTSKTHLHSPKQAKLSFVDELAELEAGNDGSGLQTGGGGSSSGLAAATADRFKAEKRAAARQRQCHVFHTRGHGEGGTSSCDEGASPRAAGGGGGVALVDDDSDYGGARGGSQARPHDGASGVLGRIHFGAAQARGMRPYMEDRHCIVASMQLLSNALDGGAQPGPPLPPDGVPRSYAAIFDGAQRARACQTSATCLVQGSMPLIPVGQPRPNRPCCFRLAVLRTEPCSPLLSQATTVPVLRIWQLRGCMCCSLRIRRCACTQGTLVPRQWREPKRLRLQARCALRLAKWTRRRCRCQEGRVSAMAQRHWW